MTDVRPVRIGAERVTTDDTMIVSSPYDGHEIGRVPSCTAAHVDVAVVAAQEAMLDPLPAWKRAEILERAADVIASRKD